jgi:hypothetical protein
MTTSDCRSEEGRTIAIIEAIQTLLTCLYEYKRPWESEAVQEALADLFEDENFQKFNARVTDAGYNN